jgi:hypothetical protein
MATDNNPSDVAVKDLVSYFKRIPRDHFRLPFQRNATHNYAVERLRLEQSCRDLDLECFARRKILSF